mmetsp:Transcript_19511/g.40139  ORF Transcript_19511/g.40139 Transcript_19511/m.40139 type:complete len:427 (+) Transcript_19511:3803-5083(+)
MVNRSFSCQYGDEFQFVSLSTFVVIGIMCRCDLNSTCTKGHVDQDGIQDNGDLASRKGMNNVLSVQMRVTGVFRVDGYGRISQHSFQTGRGNHQYLLAIFDRVGKMCQNTEFVASLWILRAPLVGLYFQKGSSLQINVIDLNVGNGRLQGTRPVSEAVRAIKQSLFVESIESLDDRLGEHIVHGKSLSRPIHTGSEMAQLGGDAISVFVLPFPDFFDEFLASQIVTVLVLALHEHFFHDTLGGDSRVVRSGNVQSGVTLHAVPTGQCVLYGSRQAVSQVQTTGNVRWGDDHDELFLLRSAHCRSSISLVKSRSLPPFLPCRLDGLRIVGIRKGDLRHVLLFSLWCGIDKRFLWFDLFFLGFLFLSGSPLRFLLFLFLSLAFGKLFQLVLGQFLPASFCRWCLRGRGRSRSSFFGHYFSFSCRINTE